MAGGVITLTGSNTYTGGTTVNAGAERRRWRRTAFRRLLDARRRRVGIEHAMVRPSGFADGQMQISGGSSGFSSTAVSGVANVTFGTLVASESLTWGTADLPTRRPGARRCCRDRSLEFHESGRFQRRLRTVLVESSTATMSGTLSGPAGGLIKDGPGTLILSGTNTYMGGTEVVAGTLVLADADALASGTSLSVGAGAHIAI